MPYSGLYTYLDTWSYSSQNIKLASIIVFAGALATIGVSMWAGVDEHSVMHHQMHSGMLQKSEMPQASYMTMDWLMTPMISNNDYVYAAIHDDMCSNDGKRDCLAASWQTHAPCNAIVPSDTKTVSTGKLNALAVPVDVQEQEEYIYANTRTKFRHISPYNTCNMEKLGSYVMWQNNELSWSIASTHNVYILIAGAFGVVALITLSTFIHAARPDGDPQTHQYNQLIVAAFLFVYITGSYWYASAASINNTDGLHRPMGMASFVYSTISLVLTFLVFNSAGVVRDDHENSDKHSTDKIQRAKASTQSEMRPIMSSGEPQQLNVSGFVPVRAQLPTGALNVGARLVVASSTGNQGMTACGCMHHPRHSKFVYGQLFAMPLIFLALAVQKQSYGLDTTTQLVVLMAVAVALIDLVLYRLWWSYNVHVSVDSKADGIEFFDLALVTVLATVLQLVVYVFFLVSELFHDDVQWIIIGWCVFVLLIKLFAAKAIYDSRDQGNANQLWDMFNDSAHRFVKADAWMFWTLTLVLALAVYVELLANTKDFKHGWLNLQLLAKDKNPVLTQMWGPSWHPYHPYQA